ncbi:MAG: hypothetical protein HY320_05310 [Armatimonadetes bacterium]|nr:hypothetical protein [Armatimonadota bacterium]
MEARLIALKLLLDELRVPAEINSVDDRKLIQKAVYLGQLTGVDLGYRFSWYLMGPYSPALTRDYYSLAEAIASDDPGAEGKQLHPDVRDRLQRVAGLLTSLAFNLGQEDWLELVASVHFLRRVSRYSHERAEAVLREKKPHLAPHMELAEEALQRAGLLQ